MKKDPQLQNDEFSDDLAKLCEEWGINKLLVIGSLNGKDKKSFIHGVGKGEANAEKVIVLQAKLMAILNVTPLAKDRN
jgi:hypothetical protein